MNCKRCRQILFEIAVFENEIFKRRILYTKEGDGNENSQNQTISLSNYSSLKMRCSFRYNQQKENVALLVEFCISFVSNKSAI